jgi:hypothetical protein
MWVAAMLAAAPGERDVRGIIETGLSEIPTKCRLEEGIRDVLDWHAQNTSYAKAVDCLHQRWDESNAHDWCHTIPNAQIVALGLLYGEGDFEKSVTRAVYPCFDTDCNGATVGSIVGMILGAKALPSKWTGIMNDIIHTGLSGYDVAQISDLGHEMFQLHLTAETGKEPKKAFQRTERLEADVRSKPPAYRPTSHCTPPLAGKGVGSQGRSHGRYDDRSLWVA